MGNEPNGYERNRASLWNSVQRGRTDDDQMIRDAGWSDYEEDSEFWARLHRLLAELRSKHAAKAGR